jgi:hypothetical protein
MSYLSWNPSIRYHGWNVSSDQISYVELHARFTDRVACGNLTASNMAHALVELNQIFRK